MSVFVVAFLDDQGTVDVDGVFETRALAEERSALIARILRRRRDEVTVWERPVVGDTRCSVCGVAPPDGTSCACFSSAAALGDEGSLA